MTLPKATITAIGGARLVILIDGQPQPQSYSQLHTASAAAVTASMVNPGSEITIEQVQSYRANVTGLPSQEKPPVEPDPPEDPTEPNPPPVVVDPVLPARQILTPGDFEYLGTYQIPNAWPQNANSASGKGLTHRYIDGQLRFYTLFRGANQLSSPSVHLWEFRLPGELRSEAPYTNVSLTRRFGRVLQGQVDNNNYRGIIWDEETQRMLVAVASNYSGESRADNIGMLSLDFEAGAIADQKLCRLNPLSYKATKGFAHVPESAWGATGNRRMVAGFGGAESMIATGPAHVGPAMIAFNPEQFVNLPSGGNASGKILAQAPFGSGNPGIRNPNYWSHGAAQPPPDGDRGYWGAADRFNAGGIWIDTGEKHGFLLFGTLVGDGQRARIDPDYEPEKISVTGNGHTSVHRWRVRLSEPFETLEVGDVPMWPTGGSQSVPSTVVEILDGGHELVIDIPASTQNDPMPPGPIPRKTGRPFKGASYWQAAMRLSLTTPYMMVYDPNDIVQGNDDPLPLVGEYPWPQQGQLRTRIMPGPHNLATEGVTYDETTKTLYLLQNSTRINVWRVK